jgi:hypothetical protein
MITEAEEQEERHPGQISALDDSSSSASISSNGSRKQSLSFTSSRPSSYLSTDDHQGASFEDDDQNRLMLLTSPTYESPAEFENFDFELPLRWYKRVWCFVLGIAGVFDILAYMEPYLRSSYNEKCSVAEEAFGESMSNLLLEFQVDPETSVLPWYCSGWATFLDRLRDYNVVIAFAFSLLWLRHSQNKAREEYYNKFTVKEDRMHLLSSTTNKDCEAERKGPTKRKKKKFNAQNAYYRRILSRTLLMPVGFYVILYHLLRGLMNGKWLYRELLIKPANEPVFLTIQDPNEYVTIDISEAHAKMSTIFALFIYLKHHFLLATTLARAEFLDSAIPRLKRKLVFNAARHPRNAIQKLKKLLKYVRWIKYIIPLVVKLNKLKANTVSTLRKRRQYRIAKKQRLVQMALLKERSPAERKRDAAILIQRVWRSHQKSLYRRVAVCFMKDKRLSAAMKIQYAYRRMALKTRIQNSRKMRELFQPEQLKCLQSERMNDEERRRLYQLQDEFMTEAKKTINKRLLMRPNTRLAVLWNSIFIFCVLVEISQNALKPWLIIPKAKQANNRKYKSMRLHLAESLIPIPVAETPTCKDIFKKQSALQRLFYRHHHVEQPTRQEVVSAFIDEITDPDYGILEGIHNETNHHDHTSSNPKIPWRCSEPISTWRDGYRDMVSLAFRPNPVSEWPACQPQEMSLVGKITSRFRKTKKAKPLPWYCSKPYSTIHDWYRSTWNFVVDQIRDVISVICFFDVFVKFFTGDIDPITGELKPKPFIRRWIIPGLLLQLLVNPAIGSFSVWFFKIIDWVMVIGPVRVLRWCIAVIVPLGYALGNLAVTTLQYAESDKQVAQYVMMLWEYSY